MATGASGSWPLIVDAEVDSVIPQNNITNSVLAIDGVIAAESGT